MPRQQLLEDPKEQYSPRVSRTMNSGSQDRKILTRGKEQPSSLHGKNRLHVPCRLIPERGRLRQIMVLDKPLSSDAMWDAMRDLHSLCARDLSVIHFPGLEPFEGACPVVSFLRCYISGAVSLRSFCNFDADLCIPLRDQKFRDFLLRSHSSTKSVDLVKLTMCEGMLSHQCTLQLGCPYQRSLVMTSLNT